ncbi:MAG: hypothetical protein K9M15_02765 [Candidatus Marinimicrobia bacterium]|nr:hypothetical protein [Candidatus Neomarinimicrobiota bacterium]
MTIGKDNHDRTELLSRYNNPLEDKKPSSWIKEIIGFGVVVALMVVGLYALGIYQIITN